MATKSKARPQRPAQPRTPPASTESSAGDSKAIEVMDDSIQTSLAKLKHPPLAVNSKANAIECALGTQARLHRLIRVMEDVSSSDILDENSILALRCYAQEAAALADAVVDRLAAEARHHG